MRLIDADALIDWMDREQVLRHITWFRAAIDNMPTIDPVKHGRWIHDGQQHRGGIDWMHCSECGYTDAMGVKSQYHYCPNCGAMMAEGEEG